MGVDLGRGGPMGYRNKQRQRKRTNGKAGLGKVADLSFFLHHCASVSHS